MSPIERVLSALEQAGCRPKPNGDGWKACCPGHHDREPSLAVTEAEDGRVLIYCHAGCTAKCICTSLNLILTDLFPSADRFSPPQVKKKRGRHTSSQQSGGVYPTSQHAASALNAIMKNSKRGQPAGGWTYMNAEGETVGQTHRYDLPTQSGEKQRKTFRPISKHPDGWRIGDPPGKWPLFNLPAIADASRIYVVEGEKAADAINAELQLVATTSAHGANSPHKTDWSPLAGKECVLLPDNDVAGRKYCEAICRILHDLMPSPQLCIIDLPGLPKSGDIVDWILAQGGIL